VRLYFLFFHVLAVILVNNVVIPFIITQFLTQMAIFKESTDAEFLGDADVDSLYSKGQLLRALKLASAAPTLLAFGGRGRKATITNDFASCSPRQVQTWPGRKLYANINCLICIQGVPFLPAPTPIW
jgi:hypothetical protein